MTPCYDLFIDRTRPGTWSAVYPAESGRITVMDCEQDGPAMWWQAVTEAKLCRRHLVALSAPLAADHGLLAGLIAAFDVDPMFGTAQPRFVKAGTGRIWPLPSDAGPVAPVPRAGLEMLASLTLTAEMLAGCIVIRREVVAAMDPVDGFRSVAGAILSALCLARRRGFRNVVVNGVVLDTDQPDTVLYPTLPADDAALLSARYPDHDRAARANRGWKRPNSNPCSRPPIPNRARCDGCYWTAAGCPQFITAPRATCSACSTGSPGSGRIGRSICRSRRKQPPSTSSQPAIPCSRRRMVTLPGTTRPRSYPTSPGGWKRSPSCTGAASSSSSACSIPLPGTSCIRRRRRLSLPGASPRGTRTSSPTSRPSAGTGSGNASRWRPAWGKAWSTSACYRRNTGRAGRPTQCQASTC